MIQPEQGQLSLEISSTNYRELEVHVTKDSRIAVGIAKRKCAAFCHVPRPLGPADIIATR